MDSIFEQINDWFFVVNVLGLAILGFFLLKKLFLVNSLKLTRLTLSSFFILAYFILMSLPSILWFFRAVHPIRYTYFLAIQSVLIFFPIGVGLATGLFRHPSRIITNFLSSSLSKTRHESYIRPFYLLMFFSSVIIILVYIFSADYIPLFGAFTRYGELETLVVRFSIYRTSDIVRYLLALTLRMFLPFCLLFSYFMAWIYKKRKWKYAFWIIFLFTLFSSLLTFEKAYSFSFFILLALAFYFKNNRLVSEIHLPSISNIHLLSKSKIRFTILILVIFVLAMLVGGIISRTQYNLPFNSTDILKTTKLFFIGRVLISPSYMAYIHFENFNNPSTFLYGKSIRLLSLFGVEFIPVTSPSFIAELWLNFGWFGVIIGTVLIGFILQFIQLTFFRKKSIPILTFYIILLLNGAWIIYGHVIATMSVSVYLIAVFFLLFLLLAKETGNSDSSITSKVLNPNC